MIPHIPNIQHYKKSRLCGNKSKKGVTLEYVVQIKPNLLIAVKLDSKNGYFYVVTMHEISQSKLSQRIRNGRLQKIDK